MDLEFVPVKLWGLLLATIVVAIIILCSNFSCKKRELWMEPNYKIPTLKRRTLKHKNKLQNSNLKEEKMEA
jgi:hypothetical protein